MMELIKVVQKSGNILGILRRIIPTSFAVVVVRGKIKREGK